jgi:cyclophilin family peptidyl-prolyl cis-trans isomerase
MGLLAALLLTGCNRSQIDTSGDTPTSAATTPSAATATTPAEVPTTVQTAAESATPAPTVPPPVIEEPGPVATLAPVDRNAIYTGTPPLVIDAAKYYYATFKTLRGDIKAQLFADRAPKTVNSFVYLARQGFYDNTTFHRVLDGFMAQGGDPTGSGMGGPGYVFENEIVPGLVFDQPGMLAMANAGPDTNGSQFFITFGPADYLNGGYTIFGKVIEGEEVLSRITRRDPEADPSAAPGDLLYTVLIEESDTSILPTPTPSPPTPTPTMTPTPFAPSSVEPEVRPLATLTATQRVNYFNTAPEMVIDTARTYTATITTSKGPLTVKLYDDEAPVAVNNFVVLANLGFYDQTPISQVQPGDSMVIGSPDNNPLNDAGYRLPAEAGRIAATDIGDIGAITYIPIEQTADGTLLSSSSQLLIALIKPPEEANAQFPFFAQVVDGLDLLAQLTTADTIESITVADDAP